LADDIDLEDATTRPAWGQYRAKENNAMIEELKERIADRDNIIAECDRDIRGLDQEIKVAEQKLERVKLVIATYPDSREARATASELQTKVEKLNASRLSCTERRGISVGIRESYKKNLKELQSTPEYKKKAALQAALATI
jgi:chromosome segregation ATPase